jgi:hypothetical protein
MPTSKKRGGKKAHNKRIKKRNTNLKNMERAYEKVFTKVLEKQLENINLEENGTSRSEETPSA